jgi:hypothetical protein
MKWVLLVALLGLIAVVSYGLRDIGTANTEEQRLIQQRAVERAAVLCYALEGAYPPYISYLEDRYGLIVDRDKFIVVYDAFSSNVRPVIRVHPLQGD